MSELRLTVVRVQDVAPAVKCLTLRGAGAVELPDFSAGAHIKITLPDGDERSYSLVDLGRRVANEYQLAVRLDEDGKGGSRFMHGLQAGDVVTCQPPQNEFPLRSSDTPPLLIAGGIGVTPITGMLAALKGKGFDFHYAGRAPDALAFVPELRELAAAQMHLHFDGTDSALDLGAIFRGFDPMRPVYVCGPKGMIEAVKAAALAAGVAADNIYFELFGTAPQAGDQAFEVELASTGAVYEIPAGQSIIEVLEAAGVDLMYDCQRGDCGICQVDVVSGTPDHRDVVLSDDEKAAGEVMQICVSRAKSARLVLDI